MIFFRALLAFTLLISFSACSLLGSSEKRSAEVEKAAALNKNLGPKLTDYGLGVMLKFHCGSASEEEPFKLRAYKYKLRVLENNKELTVAGTQTRWLDTNLSEIKLKYAKGRKITFKNVEISTDKWIRAFPESQAKEPIALTLQECKDMGSY